MDSNTSSTSLADALRGLDTLTAVLADESAGLALVRADGTWHLEQNGAVRRQSAPLSSSASRRLIDTVHRRGPARCLDRWWVRPMTAGPEGVVVFIRRPQASPEGLSTHTLQLLNNHLPDGTNGLIFGASQMARSSLLLSMTDFLPRDLVIYIGPVPPIVPNEVSLLHALPPRHDRDRRELALLLERASAVLFDGPVQPADLRLLFTGPTIRHRWIAADAKGVDSWRDKFNLSQALTAPITTHIGVRSSPLQKLRIDHFAVLSDGKWQMLLDRDDLDAPPTSSAEVTVADSSRLSARMTSPVDLGSDRAAAPGSDEPLTSEFTVDDDLDPDDSDLDSSVTGRFEPDEDFSVSELLNGPDEPEELLRESGEIDVPGFISRRAEALRRQAQKGSSLSTDSTPTDAIRGERIDRELPELVASSDIDDVEIPDLEPEQLRQTFNAEVDVEALKKEKKNRSIEPDKNRHDEATDRRSTAPNIPSRRIDRSSGLGAESSAASTSSEHSGQWTRPPTSSGRVIPIRAANQKRTEAPTAELGQFRRNREDSSTRESSVDQNEIETDEVEGLNDRDNTSDLDVQEVLDNLRRKRNENHDSDDH